MEQKSIIDEIKAYFKQVGKLLWQLPRQDYLAHLVVGMFIFIIFDKFMEGHLTILLALGVGVAKELVWDKWMGRGTPEVQDVVFTALGAILAYVANFLALGLIGLT